MKRADLEKWAQMDDSVIDCCRIITQDSAGITFEVDEGLEIAPFSLVKYNSKEIIEDILKKEQIEMHRNNVVACSFLKQKLVDIGGSDVLYKCIVECYGQHRPLVLSPDMIWLVINQTLVRHINENAEIFREKIVSHQERLDIVVDSDKDLLKDAPDWHSILESFYKQIERKTKKDIAPTFVADFSTTGVDERIASISTLMNGVQSYFRYSVHHCICGIPYVTLKGTPEDWRRVLTKCTILNRFGFASWYKWLKPILHEFTRTASGHPNKLFWKNIVRIYTPMYMTTHRGCAPQKLEVDGWCAALFPTWEMKETDNGYVKDKMRFDKASAFRDMNSEMLRVGFAYLRHYPDGKTERIPMELWSGIVGVEENAKTYALTPKIGWFVRLSEEEEESLDRLKAANKRSGIELTIDEVPEILNRIGNFSCLTLEFTGKVSIPDWLLKKKIDKLTIRGEIDEVCKSQIKEKFPSASINDDGLEEDSFEFDEDEEDFD